MRWIASAVRVPVSACSSAIGMQGDGSGGFQQIVFQQYTYIEQAFALWSKVANITFVRIGSGFNPDPKAYSNDATILIGNYTTGGGPTGS